MATPPCGLPRCCCFGCPHQIVQLNSNYYEDSQYDHMHFPGTKSPAGTQCQVVLNILHRSNNRHCYENFHVIWQHWYHDCYEEFIIIHFVPENLPFYTITLCPVIHVTPYAFRPNVWIQYLSNVIKCNCNAVWPSKGVRFWSTFQFSDSHIYLSVAH